MIRILFSVLAVVAAVLAIVLEKPILYAAAAVLLLIAFISLLAVLRRRHREAQTPYLATPPAPQADDLKSLGIVEIRPRERSRPPGEEANGVVATPAGQEPAAPVRTEPPPSGPASQLKGGYAVSSKARPAAGASVREKEEATAEEAAAPAQAVERTSEEQHGEQVLLPYLRALRSAIGAETVCLLRQEDGASEYQIVALVGEEQATYHGGSFSAPEPLLTAGMTQHPVAVRQAGEGGISPDSLGYSTRPSAVRQVALAPVPRPLDPAAFFLLADATEDDLLSQTRPRTLLAQFARLLGDLLDTPEAGEGRQPVRSRREIIAEEMERARDRNQPLALSLVYLNRAEVVADEGEAAVAAVERLMEDRLRQAAEHGRVVRFGELTYGVFYEGDVLEVEAWGARVQQAFAEEAGPLGGGVSIGIALLRERHRDPDAFRNDATEALREAFESGTCTIVE